MIDTRQLNALTTLTQACFGEEEEVSEAQLKAQRDQTEINRLKREVIKFGGEQKLMLKFTNIKQQEREEQELML